MAREAIGCGVCFGGWAVEDLDRLKARVSPGDSVDFLFRRRRLVGTVCALGPRRAVVETAVADGGGRYRVGYAGLRVLGEAADHHDCEQGALAVCRELLGVHGLAGWSARLDECVGRAAACHYKRRQISLSRLFLRAADEGRIRDAILHEIAHALAGYEHHHDAHWRAIARGIGCSGARCHDLKFGTPRWVMECPGGCFRVPRIRRSRGRVCRVCRQPVRFVAWREGDGVAA